MARKISSFQGGETVIPQSEDVLAWLRASKDDEVRGREEVQRDVFDFFSTLSEVDRLEEAFVREVEWLARDLQREADSVKDRGVFANVNSLGIVQGRGSSADIACAKLDLMKERVLRERYALNKKYGESFVDELAGEPTEARGATAIGIAAAISK